ncbi:uncharacterized protein JN550_008232 [Neoarthrinium moseri]|uniref:uncharacterized protein n=1 Tax=Neoarthrinium moseri TaxID=1658444 RepID=UPI001FDCF817|nr:uncharacterized protein JN550_008232 [Neoarthrinium moseri]KAI1865475.1 hypothetical protein JN550_008232 [Neoarthrinium moseri]
MGLSGTKNRRKLNEDPNNTKWSRNEATFGQKILRAHGWEPGQYLGAQDSSHAELHSAASSAPIKVTLKDDTRGLGAKVRHKQGDVCTGLDVFKDLLGRLNGKSDETIKQEQAVRSELKTSIYIERKWGPMRFVKGGLLVGDQITDLIKQSTETNAPVKTEETESAVDSKSDKKKSKKRKAEDSDILDDAETDRKDKKKKKRSKDESSTPGESTSDSEKKRRKKEKKERKARKAELENADGASDVKPKSKKDKKRKESKRSDAPVDDSDQSDVAAVEDSERAKKKKKRKPSEASAESASEAVGDSVVDSGTSTPVSTGTSTPQPFNRRLVRSRFIASKQMAMSDMTALNQILYVKPV